MVFIFSRYGIGAALAFAVVTDLLAALTISGITFKAGFETLIIALFVYLGVWVAPLISTKLLS
jgi:divalent metal cation (Fe/Co/Zn/Cd) transporter